MHRFKQLDSLRGLAACTVVAAHFVDVFPGAFDSHIRLRLWWAWYTPLHLFWAGTEAVVLFFTLSGFVLYLAVQSDNFGYSTFIYRRICRIYIPYVCSILLALLIRKLVYHGISSTSSRWLQAIWTGPISYRLVLQHISLITSFNNERIVPVIWSLVHEMRVSIVFPLIAAFIKKKSPGVSMLVFYTIALIAVAANVVAVRLLHFRSDYLETLVYLPVFAFGATFAKYHKDVTCWFNGMSSFKKLCTAASAVLLYTFRWWFLPSNGSFHYRFQLLDVSSIMLGASLFMVMALGTTRFSRILLYRPLNFIGKMSYSLYLIHTICIVGLLYTLDNILPIGLILVLSLPIIFIISYLNYVLVEEPSIRMGRAFGGHFPRSGK